MAQKKYASLSTLQTFLDNIKAKFALKTHSHTMSDISDYTVDATLSSTSTNPIQNKVINAELDAISDAMGALDLAIDGKADASHDHNNLYYTETEVDTMLASKSDTTHKHDSLYDSKGSASTVQNNLDTHIDNTDIHFTSTERTKLTGIETGAQKNTITGVKGNSESSYRTGNVNITATNIGLGNVDNTSDANKPVSTAQQTAIDTALNTAKEYTDTKTSGLASTSSVNTSISNHNTSTTAHNDIRDLITGLTTRLNTLADSDDTTLDQMSEVVAYIKSNKSLIDGITTSKVNVADIVDNLTTNVTNKPLSAAQGVVIQGLIDALEEELDELQRVVDTKATTSALDSHVNNKNNPHEVTLDQLGITATATELNKLDGVTATTAELNYVDGVTSNIQTQLNGKVPTTRTVNGKALSSNVTLSASDVGADASGSASSALSSAKTYTDQQVATKSLVQIVVWGAND